MVPAIAPVSALVISATMAAPLVVVYAGEG
jgi:hypothetical protein